MKIKQFALVNYNKIKSHFPEMAIPNEQGYFVSTSTDNRNIIINDIRIYLLHASNVLDRFNDVTSSFILPDGVSKTYLVTGILHDVDNDEIYHFRNKMVATSIKNSQNIGQCIFKTIDKTSPTYGIDFQLTRANTKFVKKAIKHMYLRMLKAGTLLN